MHFEYYHTPIGNMGVTEIDVWLLIRRYDKIEPLSDKHQTSLHCFTILAGLTLEELRLSVYYWAGVETDGTKVVKIRSHDNTLIPLSALFKGSQKEKPFIIDVVRVHQFCPVEKRTIPPGCIDALKLKLSNLENRVMTAESHLPELSSSHAKTIEIMAAKLANCVSFLDRRLDELAPKHWKEQIESAAM